MKERGRTENHLRHGPEIIGVKDFSTGVDKTVIFPSPN
jgi:hypothetical protein